MAPETNHPTESPETTPQALAPADDRFGRTNWLLLIIGVAMLVVGFWLLSMADERAANLAGRLSPFVILGGYGAIFVGLVLRSGK
jgi:hypothetical protein